MTNKELKKLLTPEFLSTLHTVVECYGWSGDMIEVMNFCEWCYDKVGCKTPKFDVDFEVDEDT